VNGPCAKGVVTATIVTEDGSSFVGTNECRRPQGSCPRGDMPTGVGYDMCRRVCCQVSHAEVAACRAAGYRARGATLFLEGHTYACDNCKAVMKRHGVAKIVIAAPEGMTR